MVLFLSMRSILKNCLILGKIFLFVERERAGQCTLVGRRVVDQFPDSLSRRFPVWGLSHQLEWPVPQRDSRMRTNTLRRSEG